MLQSNNSLKTKILAATKILMTEFPLTSTLTPIPPRFRRFPSLLLPLPYPTLQSEQHQSPH